jgi:ketosteroid isomerase-like protein
MKKCILNLNWQKTNSVSAFSGIAMIAMWIIIMGCTNPENDLTVEPAQASTEEDMTSTAEMRKPVSEKCISIGQEITDRHRAYNAAFIDEDVDKLYYDFWAPEYYEFVPNFNKDREGMREQMTGYYAKGGNLSSYICESLERSVYEDVVYDIGAYDNVGDVNGNQFIINGYYFLRWVKQQDGVWRVDKGVAGPRGNTSAVNATTDEGPVVCYNKHQANHHTAGNYVINQKITERFAEYMEALTSANLDNAQKFWSEDIHLYGQGLDVDRDELYEYYRQFFETGSITSANTKLHYRFIHGNTVYDIGQSENTVLVNGVQSVNKTNYVIRWQRGHDGIWRINRIMDLFRVG